MPASMPAASRRHTGGDINLTYKLAVGARIPIASVDYPPAMGIRAFSVLLAALRGATVPAYLDATGRASSRRAAPALRRDR